MYFSLQIIKRYEEKAQSNIEQFILLKHSFPPENDTNPSRLC